MSPSSMLCVSSFVGRRRRIGHTRPTAFGNYATHLLEVHGDSVRAIAAGERAIELDPYERARAVIAAADRLAAAEALEKKRTDRASSLYRKSREIWPPAPTPFGQLEYCHDPCDEVATLAAEFERDHHAPAASRPKRPGRGLDSGRRSQIQEPPCSPPPG